MNDSGVREILSNLSVPGIEGDLVSGDHLVEIELNEEVNSSSCSSWTVLAEMNDTEIECRRREGVRRARWP